MDFSQFLTPFDAEARFKKDLESKVYVEGQDLTHFFDYFWVVMRPETQYHTVGRVRPPEIMFTTAEMLRAHPEHFKDTKIVPAYPEERLWGKTQPST